MLDLLKDLWDFMRERKKFWLAPIILVMLLLGSSVASDQAIARVAGIVAARADRYPVVVVSATHRNLSTPQTDRLSHPGADGPAACSALSIPASWRSTINPAISSRISAKPEIR